MITVESANNGRKGVLGFVGAIVFGAAAACFAVFMGGTLGIILASVCGAIGLCCGIGGLVANWKQSKKERDAALAYHQTGTAEHVVNLIDKGLPLTKSLSNGKDEVKKDSKDVVAVKNDTPSNVKVVSKIHNPDGTVKIVNGPLDGSTLDNLKLINQEVNILKK